VLADPTSFRAADTMYGTAGIVKIQPREVILSRNCSCSVSRRAVILPSLLSDISMTCRKDEQVNQYMWR
jgi:hypothetical protein